MDRDARDEALAWFVRLQSGDADAADRAAFADWLVRDPANRREYDRLSGVWADLGRVPDPRRPVGEGRAVPSRRRFLSLGALGVGGAAACAAGLGAAVVLTGWPGELRTGTGERRSLALADGSAVDLDAGSARSVDFSVTQRRLRLIEGRARVAAAPDPERPFAVACADGIVSMAEATVVVHRQPDSVVVAVEKGTATLAAGGRPPVRLAAGECRAYGPDGPGPLLRDGVAAETAWRQGRLVFQGQPLDAVVADLNRYHPARILLWDGPLAALRVDGSVDVGRPDAALNAIIRTLPVRTLRPFPGLVIIRSV